MTGGSPRAGSRLPLWVAAGCAVSFAVLTVLVWTGATAHLDVVTRDHFRPGDVWEDAQLRADTIVEGLKPSRTYLLLVVVAAVLTAVRRSWRPAVYLGAVAGASIVLTVGVKLVLERTDPHQDLSTLGGSYPSGHMVGVWVCLGGILLAVFRRTRWWAWLFVAVAPVAMGYCLLLQAAHWFTDLVGGSLLAWTILAVAATHDLRAPEPARRSSAEPAVR